MRGSIGLKRDDASGATIFWLCVPITLTAPTPPSSYPSRSAAAATGSFDNFGSSSDDMTADVKPACVGGPSAKSTRVIGEVGGDKSSGKTL